MDTSHGTNPTLKLSGECNEYAPTSCLGWIGGNMSGGRFDYVQFRFGEIVEAIRSTIANNVALTSADEGGVS